MIGGQSILDQAVASNAATFYVTLHALGGADGTPELSQEAILGNLRGRVPARSRRRSSSPSRRRRSRGLGVAGGFQMQLEDRGGVGLDELQQVTDEMVAATATPRPA